MSEQKNNRPAEKSRPSPLLYALAKLFLALLFLAFLAVFVWGVDALIDFVKDYLTGL